MLYIQHDDVYAGECYILHTLLFLPDDDARAEVLHEIQGVKLRWKYLFLMLNVKPSELDCIEHAHGRMHHEALEKATRAWLTTTSNPSWKKLVEAIANEAGGDNLQLAREISQRHLRKSESLGLKCRDIAIYRFLLYL